MNKLQGFTQKYLKSLFIYDSKTGIVTNRIGRKRALVGMVAGTIDGKGYLHVCVDYKFIRLHRLIFFMENGWVPKIVDHKNRKIRDNRLNNLRACSNWSHSTGNIGVSSHNSSGYKGVSKNSRSGMWHAQIKIWGRQTYLGRFSIKKEAARAYDKAAKEHFGDFASINNV